MLSRFPGYSGISEIASNSCEDPPRTRALRRPRRAAAADISWAPPPPIFVDRRAAAAAADNSSARRRCHADMFNCFVAFFMFLHDFTINCLLQWVTEVDIDRHSARRTDRDRQT